MNVISRKTIREAATRHFDAESALMAWFKIASKAQWHNLHDVRNVLPYTDHVDCCLVFNICGNNDRLICRVSYANQWTRGTLWVKHFLPHAEYDKQKWRKDCK